MWSAVSHRVLCNTVKVGYLIGGHKTKKERKKKNRTQYHKHDMKKKRTTKTCNSKKGTRKTKDR